MKRAWLVGVLFLVAFSWNPALTSAQPVPNPALSGPVSGGTRGQPFGALSAAALAEADYIEAEYFFEGVARSYLRADTWTTDGVWNVVPADVASYKVRMVVRRPAKPQHFNGTVLVEWLNVTALAEGAADFFHMQEEISIQATECSSNSS